MNGAELDRVQKLIADECDAIKNLLLEKNRAYGASVLEPIRVFSKSDSLEQIKVRIDDKLKRLQTMGTNTSDEDTVKDLIGYLIIYRVATALAGNLPEPRVLTEDDSVSVTRPCGGTRYALRQPID